MLQVFLCNLVTEEEKKAFTALYRQYRNYLFAIANDIIGDWHLAEDAVIEAFFRISKDFSKIDPADTRRTKQFLAVVIRNVSIDILRKRNRKAQWLCPVPLDDVAEIVDGGGDPLEQIMDGMEYEALLESFNRLDEKTRDILYLRYVMEYSVEETAEIVNVSRDVVYKRLQRARVVLREEMGCDEC